MPEQTIEGIAVEFLKTVTAQLDPYTSEKGVIEVREKGDKKEAVLLTPSHIQFARYGRGPGKNPPLDPLLEWVKKNNVQFGNSSERGTAFALQKMIAKNGTKNWVKNAPNALEEAIKANLEEYNNKLASQLTVTISDSVNQIYKTVFPETTTFEI